MISEAASLLHRAGSYAYEFGLYEEAQLLLSQALSMRQKLLGQEHLETQETLLIFNQLLQVIKQENTLS